MAIDAPLKAFLDLTDGAVAAYADGRAAALDLTLPEPTLVGVRENLALLRAQTALFVAALFVADPLAADQGERTGAPAEPFQP